jgi:integrase
MRITKPQEKLVEENESLKVLRNRMLTREGKSEETFRRYMDGVKQFTEYSKANSADEAFKLFSGNSDRTQMLDGFVDWMLSKGRKPVNIKALWQGVKKWLIVNRVTGINWDYISRPKVSSQIKDRIATPEELQLILSNKVNLRDKALFMTAACSGLRLGTVMTLQVKDYKPVEELGMISVEGGEGRKLAKGKSYFTFVTPETRLILEGYFKTRENLNPNAPLFAKEDGRPIAAFVQNVSRQWRRLVKRARLLNKIEGHTWIDLHGHTLRKYFQTHCKLAGCRADFVDYWMGHHPTRSDEYMNDSYFRPDLKAHINEYHKAVSQLSIYSKTTDEKRLRTQMMLDFAKLHGYSEEKLRRLEEVLARARDVGEAITEFRRLEEDSEAKPRTMHDGNGKYLVAKSEDEMIQRLHDGWRVVQALNHNKYLLEQA